MKVFILSGFCSFTENQAGFLIPFLTQRGTNSAFVQELDDNYIVIGFMPFLSEHFKPVQFFPNPIPIEIGSPGLLAFRQQDETITYGDAASIKEALRQEADYTPPPESAFFYLEASMFVGDTTRVTKAIKACSLRLSKAQNSKIWTTLETKSLNANEQVSRSAIRREALSASSLAHEINERIERLYRSLPDEIWVKQFRTAWNLADDRRRLIEPASSWITNQPIASAYLAEILLLILRSFKDNDLVRQKAQQWLKVSKFSLFYWGSIWLELNRKSEDDKPFSRAEQDAFEFLENAIDVSDSRSIEIWAKVWNRIRKRSGLSKRLVGLAERALSAFGKNSKFIQMVLSNIYSEPFVVQPIKTWLTVAQQSTNAWADTYIRLINNYELDQELVQMGLDWLHQNPNMNRWKSIWTAIKLKSNNQRQLIEIARHWLERAYPDITVWPEIMAEVITSGSASHVELEIAERWLTSHENRRHTETYKRLANLVDDPRRKSLPPDIAILTMRRRLEAEIETYAKNVGLAGRYSYSYRILQSLRERNLIRPDLLAAVDDLISIANSAEHESNRMNFSSNDVIRYGDRLDQIISQFHAAVQNRR